MYGDSDDYYADFRKDPRNSAPLAKEWAKATDQYRAFQVTHAQALTARESKYSMPAVAARVQ
eukprot:228861-Prorocentrum_minimum.AAC.1